MSDWRAIQSSKGHCQTGKPHYAVSGIVIREHCQSGTPYKAVIYIGAFVSGLDVMEDNGTVYMVAGTHGPGTLFLYMLNTVSTQPIPEFQSITRSGESEDIWNTLYTNKQLGDLRISDIG
ncbi:hypothetical protein MAR_025322 [Mya arenaria]|uniref:Uncharacterized protein n=1 Tax=Mya arenaria TaxID=6604 RepID=A0ABY7DTA9_MYAAR|nr:hypothetical protein MAR_025322 [Mya arenaria]